MKTSRGLALLIIVLSAIGCATINKNMESWVDHHYSELVMSWGPPQQVYDDGQGGRILVYTLNRQFTTPGQSTTTTTGHATIYDNMIWGQAQSITTYQPPQTSGYTAFRSFRIDPRGYIYAWSWRGL